MKVGKNSVVMGHVPPNLEVGEGCVIIGATDERGNTIIDKPMAVGHGAQAGLGSIAIGAFSGAGILPQNIIGEIEEIQKLLKSLEQTNPTATETEKVAYVNDETTPSFKRRVARALQASGETAIDEFILENKYLKVAKAAVKGWLYPVD
jgi:hypothetical protein